jgi:hypothetical protein
MDLTELIHNRRACGHTRGGRIGGLDPRAVAHDAARPRRKFEVVTSDDRQASDLHGGYFATRLEPEAAIHDADLSDIALDAAPGEQIDYMRFFNGVPHEVGQRRYEEYLASRGNVRDSKEPAPETKARKAVRNIFNLRGKHE